MNTYFLIFIFGIVLVLLYFLAFHLFSLIQNVIGYFIKSLKGFFIMCGVIGSIWIFQNPVKANAKFHKIKNWDGGKIEAILTKSKRGSGKLAPFRKNNS